VEEFPHEHRGRALGAVTAMSTLGGIFVGVLAFAGLQDTPLDWRAFYLVGIIPLVVVAIGRRNLLETRRFDALKRVDVNSRLDTASMGEPWRPEFRRNLIAVGFMH